MGFSEDRLEKSDLAYFCPFEIDLESFSFHLGNIDSWYLLLHLLIVL